MKWVIQTGGLGWLKRVEVDGGGGEGVGSTRVLIMGCENVERTGRGVIEDEEEEEVLRDDEDGEERGRLKGNRREGVI